MKRALLAVFAAACFSATGCHILNDPCLDGGLVSRIREDRDAAYHVGHPGLCHKVQPIAAPGPPTPTVGYPYYTLRGPRDFFDANPPPLGP